MLAPLLRSEASGDLALDTPGTYIALSLVVVKGDALVVEEAQHRLAVLLAPQGQVSSRRLFRSAPSPRDRGRWGIGLQSSVQQRIEPVFESPHEFGGDRPILLTVVHQAQRVPQLSRPHLQGHRKVDEAVKILLTANSGEERLAMKSGFFESAPVGS